MEVTLYLFLAIGLVGGCDVSMFHIQKCRLYKLPSARAENVTHAIRALLFGSFLLSATYVQATGAWVFLYVGLCAIEVLNSTVDTLLETRSRAPQGGLPAGEYILHVMVSTLTGAALATLLSATLPHLAEPTALIWRVRPELAEAAPFIQVSVAISLLFFAFETFHVFKQGAAAPLVDSSRPATPSQSVRPA
jgi:hypothetical protein